MKKLSQIVEVFDSHYPYSVDDDGGRRTDYSFKTEKGTAYKVYISAPCHSDYNHELEFNARSTPQKSVKNSIGVNNAEGASSHKVFGTVKKITNEYLKKNAHVPKIEFSNITGEESRTKLYHHFAKSIDPSYEHHTDKYQDRTNHYFTVKNPYHKEANK